MPAPDGEGAAGDQPDRGRRDITDDDRRLIIEATRAAGELVAGFLGRSFESWTKTAGEVVTEADIAANRLLRERLALARPGYGWLSEESADDPERLGRSHIWVVDPIDGTRDFVQGRTGFAVSVALVVNGQPVLAALDAPARGEFYAAEAGRGATLNGRPIRVSGREELDGCRMPVDAGILDSKRWGNPLRAVAVDKPNGLALRVAMVASGAADLFLQPRRLSQWDIAAAALVLSEAGGRITDAEGRDLVFNRAETRFRGLIAATPALYEVARREMEKIRRPSPG